MTKQKTTPQRKGPSYPNYSYRSSLKVLEVVGTYGARKAEVPKSILAQELQVGENSSGLYAMIASAKCFGMVEGTRGLTLTENGQRYCFPTSDHDRKQSSLAFLNTPEAFRFLIERFDGNKLPPALMMANLLITTGMVPKSWAARAAGLFVTSATEVGVIDSGGFLRFNAARHTNGTAAIGWRVEEDNDLGTGTADVIARDSEKLQNQLRDERPQQGITLWKSGAVRVETPDPLTKDVWERLRKYVDSMEPEPTKGQVSHEEG